VTASVTAALLLIVPPVAAQSTLGEVLDAGATRMSADDFRNEIVQRVLVGPSPVATGAASGSDWPTEILYAGNGTVAVSFLRGLISGAWKFDDSGKVCTELRTVATNFNAVFPWRCQVWFKLGDRYFVADSDWDRSARVVSRTVK
jgi:hypothetical protein